MNYVSVIGTLYILHLLYRFVSFISLYFLTTYPLDDYLTGESPAYALVTGASDGIGKGIAKELYRRGFNLILHGRNLEKMKRVVDEIRALQVRGNEDERDVRIFLADGTKGDHDFQSIVAPFRNLNISILINNVEGSSEMLKLDEWATSQVTETINMNISFPLGLIRVLLPQFRKRTGKCLIVNIGSMASEIPPPRLALYASCKRFLKTLAWSLSVDERYFTSTNVRALYLTVGEVSTKGLPKPVTLLRPDADTFGKAVVARIACGRMEVTPYVVHAVNHWLVLAVGESLSEWFVAQWTKQLFALEDDKKKQQ